MVSSTCLAYTAHCPPCWSLIKVVLFVLSLIFKEDLATSRKQQLPFPPDFGTLVGLIHWWYINLLCFALREVFPCSCTTSFDSIITGKYNVMQKVFLLTKSQIDWSLVNNISKEAEIDYIGNLGIRQNTYHAYINFVRLFCGEKTSFHEVSEHSFLWNSIHLSFIIITTDSVINYMVERGEVNIIKGSQDSNPFRMYIVSGTVYQWFNVLYYTEDHSDRQIRDLHSNLLEVLSRLELNW